MCTHRGTRISLRVTWKAAESDGFGWLLFSFNNRSLHGIYWGGFHLFSQCAVFHCMDTRLLTEGHLGCFWLLGIIKNVQLTVLSSSLGQTQESKKKRVPAPGMAAGVRLRPRVRPSISAPGFTCTVSSWTGEHCFMDLWALCIYFRINCPFTSPIHFSVGPLVFFFLTFRNDVLTDASSWCVIKSQLFLIFAFIILLSQFLLCYLEDFVFFLF